MWFRNSQLLLLLVTPFFVACAIPRAGWMHDQIEKAAPVISKGERVEISADPWFSEPSASTTIDSSLSPADLSQWYRKNLESRGWKFTPAYSVVKSDGSINIRMERSLYLGPSSLELEHQTLDIAAGQNKKAAQTQITFYMYCETHYLWDVPTKIVFIPFYWTIGEKEWLRYLFAPF